MSLPATLTLTRDPNSSSNSESESSGSGSGSYSIPMRGDSRTVVEAEALPRKVGELGYDPAIHGVSRRLAPLSSNDSTPLGPHPAERIDPSGTAAESNTISH